MAKQGYIKLYRQISETAIWIDSDKIRLWLWCLFKCNFKESECLIGNQVIKLSKGQFVTGRKSLELEFNKGVDKEKVVSGKTLYRWLEIFEKMKMLSIKKTNKYSIITVLNWNSYQGNVQQVSNKCPADVQQMSTVEECIKNDKNDKELLKDIVEYLNGKTGKSFKSTTQETMKHINGRINEGYTLEDFKSVIDTKVSQWKNDKNMNKFLRPSTLFSPTNFENYLNEKGDTNETTKRDTSKDYGIKVV